MFLRRRTEPPPAGQGAASRPQPVVASPAVASPARKPLPSPAGAFDPENLTEADLDLLAANKRVRSGIQSRMGREGLAKRKAAEAARKALTHAGSPA